MRAYETMNGWQLFISVSDSNVAGMDMKAPHDCRDPPLNTHIVEPFVSSQRKHFHFLGHIQALFVVCLSTIWGYLGRVRRLLQFYELWFGIWIFLREHWSIVRINWISSELFESELQVFCVWNLIIFLVFAISFDLILALLSFILRNATTI